MNRDKRTGTSWPDYLNQLRSHFATTTRHRCLLWVDPAQADPFEGHDIVENTRVRVPIRHVRFELTRAPYLVALDLSNSADLDLFRDSVELAWRSWSTAHLNAMLGQPICGWVSSETDAKAVARHWGIRCHLHLFKRQARICRFQDPGVREWLWPALNETQQQAILGTATEIVAIGRMQQLVHHRLSDSPESSSSTESCKAVRPLSLQLDHATWNQLDDYAVVHAAWLKWRNSVGEETVEDQATGWERPIFRALTHARRLGLRDETDCELFAFHALQLGPDFYRNSRLDGVWRKTQAGEFYGCAVEEVTGSKADQLSAWVHTTADS